jgi:hypothetical protein
MRVDRTHMQKPGTKRHVLKFTGISQYTSRCGLTVYAVRTDLKLVTCKRCLESAQKEGQ